MPTLRNGPGSKGIPLFKNIKNYIEFRRRVETLWADDYEVRELEEFPSLPNGGFTPERVKEILCLARLHPEYHILSRVRPDLYINTFVKGAVSYFLAEGDSDPKLIHDPYDKLDTHLLHSLNSGRSSPRA